MMSMNLNRLVCYRLYCFVLCFYACSGYFCWRLGDAFILVETCFYYGLGVLLFCVPHSPYLKHSIKLKKSNPYWQIAPSLPMQPESLAIGCVFSYLWIHGFFYLCHSKCRTIYCRKSYWLNCSPLWHADFITIRGATYWCAHRWPHEP